MIILHVFAALAWATCSVGIFVGGAYLTYRYALEADAAEVPVILALRGISLRLLATLVAVSLLVGVPLLLMGF